MRNLSLGWLSSLDGLAGRCLCGCIHGCVGCAKGRGRGVVELQKFCVETCPHLKVPCTQGARCELFAQPCGH